LELAMLAHDILVWTQLLTLDGEHAISEPSGCGWPRRERVPPPSATSPDLAAPRRAKHGPGSPDRRETAASERPTAHYHDDHRYQPSLSSKSPAKFTLMTNRG
jgi:hypothetical protein